MSPICAKTTMAMAKRGGIVKVETLNISGMQRNRRRGRALGDAGGGRFVRQLEYKCAWDENVARNLSRRSLWRPGRPSQMWRAVSQANIPARQVNETSIKQAVYFRCTEEGS